MKKLLPWMIAAALLLVFVLFIVSVLPRMGEGSPRYARKWRRQLLACHSLDEVKQHLNCVEIEWRADGANRGVNVTKIVRGRSKALIRSFPDGRWIACVYADSHGGRGGGTVVSRDSSGEIHIFFGHVCGDLHAEGETLEEFYDSLRSHKYTFWGKEVFLD